MTNEKVERRFLLTKACCLSRMVRSDLTHVVGRSIKALHGCQLLIVKLIVNSGWVLCELGMGLMWGAKTLLNLIIL